MNRTLAKASDVAQPGGLNQIENQSHASEVDGAEALVQAGIQAQGVVQTKSNREIVLQMEGGFNLEIARRSWRFAQEQGFSPQIGDVVAVIGFDEQGSFEIISMTNLSNGQVVHLRDETGHPLWATEH